MGKIKLLFDFKDSAGYSLLGKQNHQRGI